MKSSLPQKSTLDKLGGLPPPLNVFALSGYAVYRLTAFFGNKIYSIISRKNIPASGESTKE